MYFYLNAKAQRVYLYMNKKFNIVNAYSQVTFQYIASCYCLPHEAHSEQKMFQMTTFPSIQKIHDTTSTQTDHLHVYLVKFNHFLCCYNSLRL